MTEATIKIPLASSASGKNAYYIGTCRHTEHNPAYAACLDKIRRAASGEAIDTRCTSAINLSTCQAKNMRQSEELAGHALYFVEREAIATNHNKVPPWAVKPTGPNEPSAIKQPAADKYNSPHVYVGGEHGRRKPSAPDDGGSYADAINEAIKETTRPRTPEMDAMVGHIHGNPAFSVENVAKSLEDAVQKTPAPAHSKSEYARRVAQGDTSVLPPVPKTVTPAPTMQPGETPLAFARRVAATR